MFSTKNKKRGFTLIEMLIVIVIIGILAAALIPRLSSARGRANDVARKADLAQVAAALVAYQIDHGKFPVCPSPNASRGCTLAAISSALISAGLDGIPSDINTTREISGIDGGDNSSGQYAYIPITKRGIPENGFVLMAATETAGGSNRVATDDTDGIYPIIKTTDFTDIKLCTDITKDPATNTNNNGLCKYKESDDLLRYIYVY